MQKIKQWFVEAKSMLKGNKLHILNQAISLSIIICTALSIWKTLVLCTGSESPVVVVLSGSMEPAFYRGDILTLTMGGSDRFEVGEIVVYKIKGRDIPIIHRVIESHYPADPKGKARLLTKGDNNNVDDRGLYNPGVMWLDPKDVVGRARGFLPYAGMVTIILNDFPIVKYVLLGSMSIIVMFSKEE